jgi:hypothetical protein
MSTNIKKASGIYVPFSASKLRQSLLRSGASEEITEKVISEIEAQLYDGMSTKHIYQLAFKLLKKFSKPQAAKYKLKNAIMELGPTGFPFEKYFAEILKYQGYSVKVGEIVKGHCVNHEIDVIAEKGNMKFMIECKFHNATGINCDVKIPLYIHSRFKDVEKKWIEVPGNGSKFHQGWVVTNTKFTGDAIQYGLCENLHLVGWDFPHKNSLRDQIDSSGLYPLTCLTTLTKSEKQKLLDKKIVLCQEINSDPSLLSSLFISEARISLIMNEVRSICKGVPNKIKQ